MSYFMKFRELVKNLIREIQQITQSKRHKTKSLQKTVPFVGRGVELFTFSSN